MTVNSEKTIPAGIGFRPVLLETVDQYAQQFCKGNRSIALSLFKFGISLLSFSKISSKTSLSFLNSARFRAAILFSINSTAFPAMPMLSTSPSP